MAGRTNSKSKEAPGKPLRVSKQPVKEEQVDEQLMDEILTKVACGQSIIHALKSDARYPEWHLFAKVIRKNEAFARQYVRAMQLRAFSLEGMIEEYKQLLLDKAIDPQTANVLIQTNKWQCAKFYPKLFGDNIKLSVMDADEQQAPSITIEVVKRQLPAPDPEQPTIGDELSTV